jgi:GrpB-like predicted nucleotidyltransferase (UPF0157 family)
MSTVEVELAAGSRSSRRQLSDWKLEPSAAGGIASIRLRGYELLASDARPVDAGAARWRIADHLDRVRVEPDRFEVAQSMVWPFRHEPDMEVVVRGRDLMPPLRDAAHVLRNEFSVRFGWPSSGVAVSIAWDEPRLQSAVLTLRSDPDRVVLAIGAGNYREVRQASWWVHVRDGSGAKTIEVVDYDPAWPASFRQEGAKVRLALGDQVMALEHGGSTAVPGLAAKPIIDMWAALKAALSAADVAAMAAIGYEHLGEGGLEDQELFVKRQPPVCHLHCYPAGHPELDRHLAFRDWLLANPDGAAAYGRLKRDLARRFAADRVAYTEAKSDFIQGAISKRI